MTLLFVLKIGLAVFDKYSLSDRCLPSRRISDWYNRNLLESSTLVEFNELNYFSKDN